MLASTWGTEVSIEAQVRGTDLGPRLERQSKGCVSFDSHDLQRGEELPALAVEETVCGEARDCGHCAGKLIGQRTNDRYMGEVGADEFARDWEDQAGLNEGGGLQRWVIEEIRKRQAGYGVGKWRHRLLHSIAREVTPFQEVSDLVSTDAKSDLQHLRIRHLLTHGRVKTRATLLNHSEVKSRHIRDRLSMEVAEKVVADGRAVEVGIVSGNGCDSIESDRLRKGGAEVRIGCAAITNEPTRVDIEIHEIGEAFDAR